MRNVYGKAFLFGAGVTLFDNIILYNLIAKTINTNIANGNGLL
jgi:hypothetical protein